MPLSKKKPREAKPAWMFGPMLRHQQQTELVIASLRPASKRRVIDTGPSRATRAGVIARDERCVCCGKNCASGVAGFDYSIQHMLARGAGGTSDPTINDPSMLLLLCGHALSGCHGRAESDREWARQMGYARLHGINQYEGTVRWHGREVTLTSDFRVIDVVSLEEVFA